MSMIWQRHLSQLLSRVSGVILVVVHEARQDVPVAHAVVHAAVPPGLRSAVHVVLGVFEVTHVFFVHPIDA